MQYIYRNRFSMVINGDVSVYRYEKYKFEQPFFSFQAKHIFIGKSRVCEMTEFSGAADNNSDFDGNIILLDCQDNEYVHFSALEY